MWNYGFDCEKYSYGFIQEIFQNHDHNHEAVEAGQLRGRSTGARDCHPGSALWFYWVLKREFEGPAGARDVVL